jgi:hypothetical protein
MTARRRKACRRRSINFLRSGDNNRWLMENTVRRSAVLAHYGTEMENGHISDHDLEQYYLGMITRERELEPLEEHLLGCPDCARRAEETESYVDALRRALMRTEANSGGGPKGD